MDKKHVKRESFSQSLPPILLCGVASAGIFYALILTGPLDNEVLRRYCLNHPVAVACVFLFFTGIITLGLKWYAVILQSSHSSRASLALSRLTKEGAEVSITERAQWTEASWNAIPLAIRRSWFGQRLSSALELQVNRGRQHQLEADLDGIAEAAADRQHESYGLLRIINWSMPMLGFLGTVLGISQTLGQLDTELLATQQQEAMNELTAGLYVAFDTTAIALILTVFLMFVQFAVSRLELNLLAKINADVSRELVPYLGVDPYDAQATLLAPVRDMAQQLVESVRMLAEQQSQVWGRSIAESQQQWSEWTVKSADAIETGVGDKIADSLEQHVDSLQRLQDEADARAEARWQQWHTTLSEQARLIKDQQQHLLLHSGKLEQIIDSTTQLVAATSDLRNLEDTIHESVSRLENIGKLENATLCLGEAVAVLGTSLERAGMIRSAPTRPRATSRGRSGPENDEGSAEGPGRKAA